MSLRNRLFLPIIGFALAALAGCGSNTNNPVAPPSGGFSNTNFNGTYTFSVFGSDMPSTSLSPFAIVGTLTACGCSAGTIAGGTVSLANSTGTTSSVPVSGSGSGYSVTTDGRGKATLSIATNSGTVLVLLDFVLTSSSHGWIIRFDGNGTGSGSIDLQPTAVTQSSLTNSYAVSLSGTDLSNLDPLAMNGSFTLDASGNIGTSGNTAGVADFNHFVNSTGAPQAGLALSGSVHVGAGTAPGIASLATSFSVNPLTFDVYAVDSTHLKLIEKDGQAFLVGDAFAVSSTTMPSGSLVFTMAGPDPGNLPFSAGGIVTSDGTSTLTSGAEDVNDNGVVDNNTSPSAPYSFTGTFTASGNGRYLVTLTGFAGGTNFVAYPSDSGVLLLEMDSGLNSGITSGTAIVQTSGAALAASQGYGMNFTGTDLSSGGSEVDEIAQFNTTSTGMTGLLDENDFPVTSPGTSNLKGTYSPGSNGTGAAGFNTGLAGMFYYAADSSTILFISADSGEVGVGDMGNQTAPASAQAQVTARHLAMIRPALRSQAAVRRQIRFTPSK